MRSTTPGEHDARFVVALPNASTDGLGQRERALLERIGGGVQPLGAVLKARIDLSALDRLVERGVVQLGGVTPSDASHALGKVTAWDAQAAQKAVDLVARKRTGSGERLAATGAAMARLIVDQLTHQTGIALLETAFAEEEVDFGAPADDLARHALVHRALAKHSGVLRLEACVNVPVVGLGASAPAYYPAVGKMLGAKMILPEHAGVANAIGAVVGRICMRGSGTVTSPSEGKFRVHFDTGPVDFGDQEAALNALEQALEAQASQAAKAAGAEDIQVEKARDIKIAGVEGREVFVEATITVEAAGRPRVADG